MSDREKVIKEFELFIKEFHPACTSEGVELDVFREVLALLKEQEDLGTELTNAVELIHKKNERIKELLKKHEAVKPKLDVDSMVCGKCGHPLIHQERLGDAILFEERHNYCQQCGRQVKWE